MACRLHASGKNGHRKREFSRTLSRVEIFEDALLLYSYGWLETKVLENDYVTVVDTSINACSHQSWYHLQSISTPVLTLLTPPWPSCAEELWGRDCVFSHYCFFFWTSKNYSKTQRVRGFFWKTGKKFRPFSNKHGYVWTRP